MNRKKLKLKDHKKKTCPVRELKFLDGEEMSGFTMGYSAEKQGFFLNPADPDSNNTRVYVLNAAVAEVKWV